MITNIIVAVLGLIFVTLHKMQGVKKDFKVSNETFVPKKFFNDEWIGIAMSVVFIAMMALTVKEWIYIKPGTEDYVTIIFGLGGAIGSYGFLLFLGGSKKYIRKVIDDKTNELDELKTKTQ